MSENDINLAIRDSVKFPLTSRSIKAADYRERLEKEEENDENCKILDTQNRGIQDIKDHMLRRKKEFLCHQNERFKIKDRKQQELQKYILNKHKIVLLNDKTRQTVVEKLIQYNKMQNQKMKNQKNRMMNIIQNLVSEYEWKDQSKMEKKSLWRPRKKVPPPEPTIEEEELVEEEIEEEEEYEDIPESPKSKKKQPPEKKKKKEKKEKKKKDKAKSKKSPKSKKSGKSSKKDKKQKEQFILPKGVMINKREKVHLGDGEMLENLAEPVKQYEEYLKEVKDFYAKAAELPRTKNFCSVPPMVLFKDYENAKKYEKRIRILNTSPDILHCKYYNILSNDDFSSVEVTVEEVGVQRVLPGNSFPLSIYFYPNNTKFLEGELLFTSQKPGKAELKYFGIPFRCEAAGVKFNIIPSVLTFKTIPEWEFKREGSSKILRVHNEMIKPCILIVRKTQHIYVEEDENTEIVDENLNLSNKPSNSSTKKSSTKKSEGTSTKKSTQQSIVKPEVVEIKSEDLEVNEGYIQDLLEEMLSYIDNVFHFNSYKYEIPKKYVLNLNVSWKNSPYVGVHQEFYDLDFVSASEDFEWLHREQIMVQSEVTGKFIQTDTEYIDYNICVINSVYQQQFTVHNYGTYNVILGFKYPSKLKEYFRVDPKTFYLKPFHQQTVCLKFIPRIEILTTRMKYYDQMTNILNCPIRICILNKESNVPPTIITVYAILTEPDNIIIRFPSTDIRMVDGCPEIYLGTVTTHETLKTDIQIENISPVRHEFGFFNLPQIISISPDYGFGTLEPNEIKTLELCLSPTSYDLITDELTHSSGPLQVSYKITCTTTYRIGGVKKKEKSTDRESKLSLITRYRNLQTKFDEEYTYITNTTLGDFKTDSGTESNDDYHPDLDTIEEDQEEEMTAEKCTKQLSLIVTASIVDYWTELSHQYVIFPDTPLGSYTTMDLMFSTINNSTITECLCGFVDPNKMVDFECHFEVKGDSDQISIEPICGNLKKGESVHMKLTAKPTVENHILQEQAKIFKNQKLMAAKSAKKGAKAGKKGADVAKPQPIDDNVSLHNCDFYPAEKDVAKALRPYIIKSIFYFLVTFPSYLNKADELLFLTTECRVIRPDFVTNLPTQFIDFGPTAISTRPKVIIDLQNIARREIEPKVSPLHPAGPFICSTHMGNKVETEHILKIPFTFAPTEEILYREYFEIKSRTTVEVLTVSGKGVEPKYEFTPKFTVCRIKAKPGKKAKCVFQINNLCEAPLELYLKKLCELQGKIVPKPIEKTEVKVAGQKGKKGKGKSAASDKKSKKKGKDKPKKVKKFSEDFTPDEEYSIEQFFTPYAEESQFKVMGAVDDCVTVAGNTKGKITIQFEFPKPPQEKKQKGEKGKKKDKGDKSSKKSDKSSKSSKGKGKDKSSKSSKEAKGMKYVAKYNIFLGKIVLIKDFIIIAEFQ